MQENVPAARHGEMLLGELSRGRRVPAQACASVDRRLPIDGELARGSRHGFGQAEVSLQLTS